MSAQTKHLRDTNQTKRISDNQQGFLVLKTNDIGGGEDSLSETQRLYMKLRK